MNLDDLKTEWKNEMESTIEHPDFTKVMPSLERETKKLDKSVVRRDRLEISIAILLIPVWGWKLFYSASLIQTMGLLLAIFACILIPYKLIKARQVESRKDDSILSFLLVERSKISNQKKLLESVVAWYITPLMTAIILITAGGKVNATGIPIISQQLMIYYGFCALLVVGLYFLNKRAVKKQIIPVLNKVERQIDELESMNRDV